MTATDPADRSAAAPSTLDLSGRVVLVTGASAGIGAAAARMLAARGATVVLTGRDRHKLDAVADGIGAATDRVVADFARLDDVRALADHVRTRYDRLDALCNNAGLLAHSRTVTSDGNELTLQVNHLGGFLLTALLEPLLIASAPSTVVTTSSEAWRFGRLDVADLSYERRRWSSWRAYCDSKQANLLFTSALARRLSDRGVVATAFHPGAVRSDFGRDNRVFRRLSRIAPVFVSPEQGAVPLIRLAAREEGLALPGAYVAGGGIASVGRRGRDVHASERLWSTSEELAHIRR